MRLLICVVILATFSCKQRKGSLLKSDDTSFEYDTGTESELADSLFEIGDILSDERDEDENTAQLADIPKSQEQSLQKFFGSKVEEMNKLCNAVISDEVAHPCYHAMNTNLHDFDRCLKTKIQGCKDITNKSKRNQCICPHYQFAVYALAKVPGQLNREYPLKSLTCYNTATYSADDISWGDVKNNRTYNSTQITHAVFRGKEDLHLEQAREVACQQVRSTSRILTEKELNDKFKIDSASFQVVDNSNFQFDFLNTGRMYLDDMNLKKGNLNNFLNGKLIHSYYRTKRWQQYQEGTWRPTLKNAADEKEELLKSTVGTLVTNSDLNKCACDEVKVYSDNQNLIDVKNNLDQFTVNSAADTGRYVKQIFSDFYWFPFIEPGETLPNGNRKISFKLFTSVAEAKKACETAGGETDVWGLLPYYKQFKIRHNLSEIKSHLATPREVQRISTVYKNYTIDREQHKELYYPIQNQVVTDDSNGCESFQMTDGASQTGKTAACLTTFNLGQITYELNAFSTPDKKYGALCVISKFN